MHRDSNPALSDSFGERVVAVTEEFFKVQTNDTHLCLEKFKNEVPVGPPKQKALLFGVLFVLSIELGTLTPLRACTNGVRISDESRCLLASKRLGRNSSYSRTTTYSNGRSTGTTTRYPNGSTISRKK